MSRRRRTSYSDDEDDGPSRKRRRQSDVVDIEDRLESLITRVGEKSTSSLESNLEGLASVLEADLPNYKHKILRILCECVVGMPEKLTVYTTLIGLLNAKNYNCGGEFTELLVRNLKEALKTAEFENARIIVRFLADLVNCHVLVAGSLLQMFDNFIEITLEDNIPQVRSDWYVYAVLSALPWVGQEMFEKKESELDKLLATIESYISKRQHIHVSALRVWAKDDPHPQEEYLDCLWAQIRHLRNNKWIEKQILRPYLAFDSVLCDALQHTLPQIIPPSHNEEIEYPLPTVTFRLFDYTDVPEGSVLPGSHAIERYLIEEHLHKVIHTYGLERKDCAATLLSFTSKNKIPLNYMIVEVMFGQLFQLPNPPFLEVAYGSILIELCKLQPGSMPQVLAQAAEMLFERIDEMHTVCIDRLASWFAYHLSNFQFRWSWDDWATCKDIDAEKPKPKFITEVFHRCLRVPREQIIVTEAEGRKILNGLDDCVVKIQPSPKSGTSVKISDDLTNPGDKLEEVPPNNIPHTASSSSEDDCVVKIQPSPKSGTSVKISDDLTNPGDKLEEVPPNNIPHTASSSSEGGLGVVRGYESLSQKASEAELSCPSKVTNTDLRKYMATVTQVLDMKRSEPDWVCEHLGHTVDAHCQHYRARSDMIERLEVAKILLIQDTGKVKDFVGRPIQDIPFTEIVSLEGIPSQTSTHPSHPTLPAESEEDVPEADIFENINIDEDDPFVQILDIQQVHQVHSSRLSYHQRLVDTVPEMFAGMIPEKPRPIYKYEQEGMGSDPGTMGAHALMSAIKSKCTAEEAAQVLKDLPNPLADEDRIDEPAYHPLKIDVFVSTLMFLGSKSFSHSFAALAKFHPYLKSLSETEEAQICVLKSLYEVLKVHKQMLVVLVDKLVRTQVVECSSVANWLFSNEMLPDFTCFYVWEIMHSTIKKMSNQVAKLQRKVEDAKDKLEAAQRRLADGLELDPMEDEDIPTEEEIDRMEEKLEQTQGQQKRLFLIIFQRFIILLTEHLARCEGAGIDYNTPWYKWVIERLQQVFLQHHKLVYTYISTLESLLFTADIDMHILEIFQQFCALRS